MIAFTSISTSPILIKLIGLDKVHVYTVSRPPVEDFAMAVPLEKFEENTFQLSKKAEIITASLNIQEQSENSVCPQDILALLRRRPCSVEDVALGLGFHLNAVVKSLEQLCSQQQARVEYITQGCILQSSKFIKRTRRK